MIKDKIIKLIGSAIDDQNGWSDLDVGEITIEKPDNSQFGDYAISIAFNLAKQLKKSPQEVARILAEEISKIKPAEIERVDAVGGYVNVFLSNDFLRDQLETIGSSGKDYGKRKKVIIEYSSPNIAKPMHIGHLRSTIIGDALANIYEALGYDVIRWNYIGDWGTQFGKLIAAYKKWGNGKALEKDPIQEMLHLYVKFHEELKNNPGLEKEGQEEFLKLENGDPNNRDIWMQFREKSLGQFDQVYKQLNIKLGSQSGIYKGESDYESKLKPLIAELEQKGVAKESEGALIIELDNLSPALLRKSDGATLYITRDLTSLEDRIQNYHPAKILYVVANQQALHFEQLFAVAKKLGWDSVELEHVKFGMVLGEDGKKLATREGNAVLLEDVLKEAEAKALGVVKEKNPDAQNQEEIAHVIALGALKYNDLRQHPYTDIKFDWHSMLDFTGNSGPYLQYTYARFKSILNKVGNNDKPTSLPLGFDPEGKLIERHIINYWDVLIECTKVNTLNGLALYLYEFATLLNRFYENVRVLDEKDLDRRNARLRLIEIAADNLFAGLKLLGIGVLDRI